MQALLVAKWPAELQYHPKSCIRQMSQLLPEQPSDVAFPEGDASPKKTGDALADIPLPSLDKGD